MDTSRSPQSPFDDFNPALAGGADSSPEEVGPGCPPAPDIEPEWLEDLPPEPEWEPADLPPLEESSWETPAPESLPSRRGARKQRSSEEDELAAEVVDTLRRVFAAQSGAPADDCMGLVAQVRVSEQVLDLLDDDTRRSWEGVFEVLEFELAGTERYVDFSDLPVARNRGKHIRDELVRIRERAAQPFTGSTVAAWEALVERVQRHACMKGMLTVQRAIDTGESSERLAELFASLVTPTTKRVATAQATARTALEWEVEMDIARSAKPLLRLSSGYYSLDWAFTNPGEPLGSFMQGEFHIRAAGTGQGKSADASMVVPAMTRDLVNSGFPHAPIILAHTEEEVTVKMQQLGLCRGQRNHDLAGNVVIEMVGSSRKQLAKVIYQTVANAVRKGQDTGLGPEPFLPAGLVLDYIQSLREENEQESAAIANSAEFLLRGAVAFNPDEMAKFSGVDFRTFTGMAWPEGVEHHRVAVVTYAQLIKQEGEGLLYKPGHRATPMSNFVMEGPDGEPAWELRTGDQRMPTQNELRGSGVMLQNATSLTFLHRSRPQGNPKVKDPETGRFYLRDTRARFILSKTRNGANLLYVPMRFDSQPSGFRGQYYDFGGEAFLAEGKIKVDSSFRESGDPLLPIREKQAPLAGYRY